MRMPSNNGLATDKQLMLHVSSSLWDCSPKGLTGYACLPKINLLASNLSMQGLIMWDCANCPGNELYS